MHEFQNEDDATSPRDRARRRLIKAGAAAVPVVLTIASRPVLGETMCVSASGAGSINLSNRNHLVPCSGLSSEYWMSNPEMWPSPYVSATASGMHVVSGLGFKAGVTPGTLFHSSTTGFGGSFFGGKPMSEVLQMPAFGKPGVGRMCATALLNAAAGRTPVLSQSDVRRMWNDYDSRGYYEPTAGAMWRSDDIVRYIASTIG